MQTASRLRSAHGRRGMTVIELLVTMTILAVALQMTAAALINTGKVEPQQRESSQALDGARDLCEQLRSTDPSRLFALYNDDPADDPGGAGSAPGADFSVDGLDPRSVDVDGIVGKVEFPTVGNELREDLVDRDLGMPRDLNLDGVIDNLDHSADYQVLPYRIRLEWTSQSQLDRHLSVFGMTRIP
jgi:prepilin-type N-terminal cleavage/methylation domain-containing protein